MIELSRRNVASGLALGVPLLAGLPVHAQDAIDTDVEAEIADSVQEEADALTRVGIRSLQLLSDRIGTEAATDPVTRSIMLNGLSYDVPPLNEASRSKIRAARYWRVPAADRLPCGWLPSAGAVDYDHLVPFTAAQQWSGTFKLAHDALSLLAARNAFDLGSSRSLTVIGFRGCALADATSPATDWAASHELRLAVPDHVTPQCVIGLWNRLNGTMQLFRASTVPEAANMYASLAIGTGTSLLPTGLYDFEVGTHKAAKPTRQPGALRNISRYVVLRTGSDLKYDPASMTDAWTIGQAHNIHAAGRGLAHPRFDSAGCQVITGTYDATRVRAEGPWAEFRRSAGIVQSDGVTVNAYANGNGHFKYMLLTGVEAMLAASGDPTFSASYYRLRPGSSGPRVKEAQAALFARIPSVFGKAGGTPSGVFDAKTSFFTLVDHKLNGPRREYVAPIMQG